MRKRANIFPTLAAIVALQALLPIASLATDGGDPEVPARQEGENRWVPSVTISGGTTLQDQEGLGSSHLFEDMSPAPVPLRPSVDGTDLAVSPFVGGSLEVMTPALPILTRPRLFLSGEVLPTFAADRELALEGDPDCVRGPEPNAPCAIEEDGSRETAFGEDAANGVGTSTTAQVDTLVFGANLGIAFPVRVGRRQLRIKPSVGWINYKVEAEGLVVEAACNPLDQCTDTTLVTPFGTFLVPGFLRETILTASESQRFNGIGPGLDVEMDTGRFGPIGVSLFLGGRVYRTLGDRTISFETSESFDDEVGTDVAFGRFEVEVDPWMYRVHVGIRVQWLGSRR